MRVDQFVYYTIIIFNALTVLLFAGAPLVSASPDTHFITLLYIIFCLLCWSWGYKKYNYQKCVGYSFKKQVFTHIDKGFLTFLFVFYLLTIIPKYGYELSCGAFDVVGIINKIIIGINDPSVGYLMDRGTPPFSWTIYFFISIIDSVFLIVGLLLWKKLNRYLQFIIVILCIFEMLTWFGKGTNFGIIMMALTILFTTLAQTSTYFNKKKIFVFFGLGLGLALFSLFVFSYNMEGRSGGDLAVVSDSNFRLDDFFIVNRFVIDNTSPWFCTLYKLIVSYLVGGYTNLQCVFNCELSWCWFMGDNPSKANLAAILFGVDFESMNYPTLIEKKFGVDKYVDWHSCYLWLANDYTLLGVPFVLNWIGKFTSSALVMFMRDKDLLSGVIFVIFSNMGMFLFANNNYIASVFYSFIFIFPFWFNTRFKYFKRNFA